MNAMIPVIPEDVLSRLDAARSVLERFVSLKKINNFALPEASEGKVRRLVVPISGGSDSSGMAVLMRTLFPSEDLTFVFCDTGAESADLHLNLSRLETYLGIKIHRVVPELNLFELIEKYGGYLPSPKARWCTKELKIKSLNRWLAERFDLNKDQVFTFVGLRADEDRFGFVSDDPCIQMRLPYHSLGMGREAVYGLLAATVGIARNYQYNSRSSCYVCFFKRRSEKCGLVIHQPSEFKHAADLEKLSDADQQRFDKLQQALHGDDGLDLQRADYFVPPAVDIRTAALSHPPKPVKHKLDKDTLDLFDVVDTNHIKGEYDEIFCAVAILVHPLLGMFGGPMSGNHGVYRQDFVSYSPTFAGMCRGLLFYWELRLNTPEVWGLSQAALREQLKIAIYQIKVPKGIIDTGKISDDSYTWVSGEAHKQIEHHVRVLHRTLRIESLRQQKNEYSKLSHIDGFDLTWESEELQRIEQQLDQFSELDLGSYVAWSGVYSPPKDAELPSKIAQLRLNNDRESRAESSVACIACSL